MDDSRVAVVIEGDQEVRELIRAILGQTDSDVHIVGTGPRNHKAATYAGGIGAHVQSVPPFSYGQCWTTIAITPLVGGNPANDHAKVAILAASVLAAVLARR